MRNQQYFTMILKLFMLLLQMKLIFSVPIETEVSEDEASRAATGLYKATPMFFSVIYLLLF